MPSPPHVGHFMVMTSRGPSVTFWRVISTSPSGEISTTYVFVRSRSSSVRNASSTVARFLGLAMSMKSMTIIPPMSRSRSWRTTSFTASRLFLVIVSSSRLPEPLQEHEVALDVLLGRALGGRADDHAALLHVEALQDVFQAVALFVVQTARHAEALSLRDEDDEPAGQRDLRRQPRALRLHRILDGLNEDRLAARDQVLDLAAVPLLELGAADLVDVGEAVLLEADLDDRRLHPGQDVVDLAEVDVARDRAALGPLDIDLGGTGVLEDRDAAFADVHADEQPALRR